MPETRSDRVSILIGSDNPQVHDVYEKRRDPLDKKAPEANLTPFGWCLVGPVRRLSSDGPQCHNVSAVSLDETLNRFSDEESFGMKPGVERPVSPEERWAISIMKLTTQFLGNRYECGLL